MIPKSQVPKKRITTLADIKNAAPSELCPIIKKPETMGKLPFTVKKPNDSQNSALIKKSQQPSNTVSVKTTIILAKLPRRIGLALDPKKWRCQICTFMNDVQDKICQTCSSLKGEKKIKPIKKTIK